MISLTLCLYIAAGVVIGMLTAFALHNRSVGWKKSRTTLAEALEDLYADLGLNVGPVVEQADVAHNHFTVARREEPLMDPAEFSDQLLRLKIALGDGAGVAPREVRQREMIAAQTL